MITEHFYSLPLWAQGLILVFGLALTGGAAYFGYHYVINASNGLMDKVKEDLFTLHGVITTIIHVLITTGFVSTYLLYDEYLVDHTPKAVIAKQVK